MAVRLEKKSTGAEGALERRSAAGKGYVEPRMREGLSTAWTLVLSIIVALTVLILSLPPRGPWLSGTWTGRDSGVFLYAGREVLNGRVPYRDFWDHKWPLIYYLDAAGLWLGHESTWGIFLLEVLSLTTATFFCFRLIQSEWGTSPAIIGSIALLASVTYVLNGGNLPEEFALSFNLVALYLFASSNNSHRPWIRHLASGVFASLPLMLKPNLAGTGVAIGLVLVIELISIKNRNSVLGHFSAFVCGVLLPLNVMVIMLWRARALGSFFDAALRYNEQYSSAGSIPERVNALYQGLAMLAPSGLPFLAIVGWVLLATKIRPSEWIHSSRLVRFALFAGPIELLLVATSARGYGQYFLALIPVSVILTGAAIAEFAGADRKVNIARSNAIPGERRLRDNSGPFRPITIAMAIAVLALPGISQLRTAYAYRAYSYSMPGIRIIRYIDTNTAPTDHVLVWGNEDYVNFYARRESPTRFIFQAPLFTGNLKGTYAKEFQQEVAAAPPELIIDASAGTSGLSVVPPLDSNARVEWTKRWRSGSNLPITGGPSFYPSIPNEINPFFDLVSTQYSPVASVTGAGVTWLVYRYDGP